MFLVVMDLGSREIITLVMDSSLVKPFCVNILLSSMDHDNSRSIPPSKSVRSSYRTQLSMASTATPSSKKGEVVEIVLNNNHANLHAWYLHGHLFQVIQRSDLETGPFAGLKRLAPIPVRRDKIVANIHVHLVLRFFYCHVE